MEVHFSRELEKKLDDLAAQTGRPADELIHEAVAGFVDEMAEIRGMLDSRYVDWKSSRVQGIDGEEAFAQLREKNQMRRSTPVE